MCVPLISQSLLTTCLIKSSSVFLWDALALISPVLLSDLNLIFSSLKQLVVMNCIYTWDKERKGNFVGRHRQTKNATPSHSFWSWNNWKYRSKQHGTHPHSSVPSWPNRKSLVTCFVLTERRHTKRIPILTTALMSDKQNNWLVVQASQTEFWKGQTYYGKGNPWLIAGLDPQCTYMKS